MILVFHLVYECQTRHFLDLIFLSKTEERQAGDFYSCKTNPAEVSSPIRSTELSDVGEKPKPLSTKGATRINKPQEPLKIFPLLTVLLSSTAKGHLSAWPGKTVFAWGRRRTQIQNGERCLANKSVQINVLTKSLGNYSP